MAMRRKGRRYTGRPILMRSTARVGEEQAVEEERFDELTKRLARPVSRRQALKVLLAATVGSAIAGRASATWAGGSNSDCAHWCDQMFAPGPDRGQCKSDAAHGTGLCYSCGPKSPGGAQSVCCTENGQGQCTSYAGATCCAGGSTCVSGTCCADASVCQTNQGTVCCGSQTTCSPEGCLCTPFGTGQPQICRPGQSCCPAVGAAACCDSDQSCCVSGFGFAAVCCSSGQYCCPGKGVVTCCASDQSCCADESLFGVVPVCCNGDQTCCGATGLSGVTCCNSGQTCCNTQGICCTGANCCPS